MHTYQKRLKNYRYPEMLSFFALLNDHLTELNKTENKNVNYPQILFYKTLGNLT